MNKVSDKLTVYFEEPFWVGVFEKVEGKILSVSQNPKRRQREVKKQLRNTGIGTKSQQALKLQQEQNKQERKIKSRKQKQAEAEYQFQLRQEKKKEKHRGR